MLAEIEAGDRQSMSHAGRRYGKTASTVVRWVMTGSPAAGGRRVFREGVKIGSSWLTSAAASGRFFAATSAIAPAPATRTPAGRDKAREATERELEAAGV